MKNIIKIITFYCCIILVLAACSSNESQAIEVENESPTTETTDDITVTQNQFDLAKMQVGKISAHNFSSTIRTTGKVEIPAKNHLKISAYTGGYVTQINLVEGTWVKKGQVLFTLENPEFVQMQQDYLEAKEQLSYLQSDYERQKTLANENIAAQKKFLKAESDYRVTIAKMEGMKKRLSLLNIKTDNISAQNLMSSISVYSPASGYVTAISAMKGMFLNPTDVAIELLNTAHLHLELSVFEKDILKVKKGQNITFRIPDASPETFEATVHLIGKTVDDEKRVVRVYGHLKSEKDKAKLIVGMYVDAEIVTKAKLSKGLPESAIVTEEEQDFVLVQKDKKEGLHTFEKKAVTVGQQQNGFVEIMNDSDFTGSDNILLEGAFNLVGIE